MDTRYKYKELYEEYVEKIRALTVELKELDVRFKAHIDNTDDPHLLTANQINLGQTFNAPIGTKTEATTQAGALVLKYSTPKLTMDAVEQMALIPMNAHIANRANIHQVTPVQLKTYSTAQINAIAAQYYNRGETTKSSHRLGGELFDDLYYRSRSNLDVGQITSGLLNTTHITTSPKPAAATLVLTQANTLAWKTLKASIPTYGFYIVAPGPSYGGTIVYQSWVADWMNSAYPANNMVDGTLAMVQVRLRSSQSMGYGNASWAENWDYYNSITLQVRNRRWVG